MERFRIKIMSGSRIETTYLAKRDCNVDSAKERARGIWSKFSGRKKRLEVYDLDNKMIFSHE